MPRLNVFTFIEMDTLSYKNVSNNVRDKIKCHTKVPLYLYIHISIASSSASMCVDTQPSVFTK
jgi:hypothetical protein